MKKLKLKSTKKPSSDDPNHIIFTFQNNEQMELEVDKEQAQELKEALSLLLDDSNEKTGLNPQEIIEGASPLLDDNNRKTTENSDNLMNAFKRNITDQMEENS